MDKRYKEIPKGLCECPVCQGTGLVEIPENEKQYSWNKGLTHMECRNCGGQTMMGKATGLTLPRRDTAEPCVHSYKGVNKGRCYTVYTCEHCGSHFDIDSGD